MWPKVTRKFQFLIDHLVWKLTIFPQKMPKIITLSGNGKVEKRHPLSKKGKNNAYRIFDIDFGLGFLVPHFKKGPQLPGKFTNDKYKQTALLKKPTRATKKPYVVNYDYNHYSMCPGSST